MDIPSLPLSIANRYQDRVTPRPCRKSCSYLSEIHFFCKLIVRSIPPCTVLRNDISACLAGTALDISMSWVYVVIPLSSVLMLLYLVKDTVRIIKGFSGSMG
jgi:TRAP-type C4-dicarboxylate transport system permease small subunit